jgi:Holliday junction resolvase
MRKAARIDDNQRDIVKALRKVGCNVLSLAALGEGAPDLLVQKSNVLFLLEIKDGSKFPSQRKLTPHQVKFHKDWVVHVVNDTDDALEAVGIKQ